jgi:hypothetical protein
MRRAATPAEVLAAFDTSVEPSHYPHFSRALDAELLLASGAVEGPYRKPHPITRWRLIGQRIARGLAALARNL